MISTKKHWTKNYSNKKEEEEKEKIKKEENNFIKNKIETEFKDAPKYLKFSETLTKNNKKRKW